MKAFGSLGNEELVIVSVTGGIAEALIGEKPLDGGLLGRRMTRATLKMRKAWAARTLKDPADLKHNRNLLVECEGCSASTNLCTAIVGRLRSNCSRPPRSNAVMSSFTGSLSDVLRRRQANARR